MVKIGVAIMDSRQRQERPLDLSTRGHGRAHARLARALASLGFLVGLGAAGCGAGACPDGMQRTGDACIDPAHPYEPEERIDHDNVVNYGGELEVLKLPAPPKSGFRLVLTSRVLEPGEELFYCHSWRLPDTFHEWIYAAELYTTAGLHHGNMYATAVDADTGPQPYPACHPGAASHIGTGVKGAFTGDVEAVEIPDVLFANTTQVDGGESYRFPAGFAYPVRHGREIVMDTHLLNPTSEPLRVEVAYDFFTMPAELVTSPVAPFVFLWLDFEIPPHADFVLDGACDWFGGDVAALMPHMHQWSAGFEVSLRDAAGNELARPYDESVSNGETQIKMLDPVVRAPEAVTLGFTCEFKNTTDHPMCMGIGENEMCFVFGYMTPPDKQAVGLIPTPGAPCITLNGHDPSKTPFDLGTYYGGLEPEVQDRLLELNALLSEGNLSSTCPEESPGPGVEDQGGGP
jgi:hypothetical protein